MEMHAIQSKQASMSSGYRRQLSSGYRRQLIPERRNGRIARYPSGTQNTSGLWRNRLMSPQV
jgi:hypothetical protein